MSAKSECRAWVPISVKDAPLVELAAAPPCNLDSCPAISKIVPEIRFSPGLHQMTVSSPLDSSQKPYLTMAIHNLRLEDADLLEVEL